MNVREWALPTYTILMELAVGSFTVLWILRMTMASKYGRDKVDKALENSLLIILITTLTAMIGAQFHLSKPYISFTALFNVGSSWLSREILFTLLFFFSICLIGFVHWRGIEKPRLENALGWLAIFFGWANTYCMAKIYLLPTQAAWDNIFSASAFFLTALLVGTSSLLIWLMMDLKYSELKNSQKADFQSLMIQKSMKWLVAATVLAAVFVVVQTGLQIISLVNSHLETVQASLKLLFKLYPALLGMRLGSVVLGAIGLMLALRWYVRNQKPVSAMLPSAYIACLFILVGEILGRFLFYAIHVRTGI